MLRSARAHPRCISHSSSAHARTSLDSRVHAHQADHTQKSESSNVFKHNKHCKHAQTERSHRHGQGSGHVRTKGWGRRHQIYMSKNQPTRSLLTFVSQDMLLVVRPPRLTCNCARAYTACCVSAPLRALQSGEEQSAMACAAAASKVSMIVGALVTWTLYTQVTKAPTIITKVPRSVPGITRVITHRGVFRLRAGVQK